MVRKSKTYTLDVEIIEKLEEIRRKTRLNLNLIIEDCIREYYDKYYAK